MGGGGGSTSVECLFSTPPLARCPLSAEFSAAIIRLHRSVRTGGAVFGHITIIELYCDTTHISWGGQTGIWICLT